MSDTAVDCSPMQRINIRQVKHDIYGKWQTEIKMKHLPSLFSCVHSRVKLFVFAMNRRLLLLLFCVLYLRITRKELKIRSYLCHLPSAVNVMLNLSIITCTRIAG